MSYNHTIRPGILFYKEKQRRQSVFIGYHCILLKFKLKFLSLYKSFFAKIKKRQLSLKYIYKRQLSLKYIYKPNKHKTLLQGISN